MHSYSRERPEILQTPVRYFNNGSEKFYRAATKLLKDIKLIHATLAET